MLRNILSRAVFAFLSLIMSLPFSVAAQEHSVARQWNDVLLEGIRNDFARPTVHARNLFHSSILMYDAWAAYDPIAQPFFLGKTLGGYTCDFQGVPVPEDIQAAQEKAIAYAMYRLMAHRFANSPQAGETFEFMNQLMADEGFPINNTSTNYLDGDPAHLGNYLAEQMIQFGLQDGSNEENVYANQFYYPLNPPLVMDNPGNPNAIDANRWQPLSLAVFIDQSGNQTVSTPAFLSPEWGEVVSFSLDEADLTMHQRDGFDWRVYHDPGMPPLLEPGLGEGLESNWKWGHTMVAVWQSHHEFDGTMIDISPATLGNNPPLPTSFDDYPNFYNFFEGGDASQGYTANPVTGQPYEPQMVPRSDYARVLAEFWADGPDSETPPGHWFKIVNTVNDHPLLEKRWGGQGPIIDDLEWDVKCYLTLGGGMHDAAIAAWSVKGYYDFGRPVSAIRFMAEKGQCTDINLPHYHPDGFPLIPGYVELVEAGDPLAGPNNEFVDEIKLYTWRGPDYIEDPAVDQAGVGWILAKNWWPYQRPSFVTPPFAGYVSGHSTYSRCAAEILTLITGDPYFPGGMSSFDAPQNEFLVFEEGPSQEILLEWATYRDASDQCSLSRIWGGIHPPCDDIPGRLIGAELGPEVFDFAEQFMFVDAPKITSVVPTISIVNDAEVGNNVVIDITFDRTMNIAFNPQINYPFDNPENGGLSLVSAQWISGTVYQLTYSTSDIGVHLNQIFLQVQGGIDTLGNNQDPYVAANVIEIDTENPTVSIAAPDNFMINDAAIADGEVSISVVFSEDMLTSADPALTFSNGDPLANSLVYNAANSGWISQNEFVAVYDASDANEEIDIITLNVDGAKDALGNDQEAFVLATNIVIDTKNPTALTVATSAGVVNELSQGTGTFTVSLDFDEDMNTAIAPVIVFNDNGNSAATLSFNNAMSGWLSTTAYTAVYNVADVNLAAVSVEIESISAQDPAGNSQNVAVVANAFMLDTNNPSLANVTMNDYQIADVNAGNGTITFTLAFSEGMDQTQTPSLDFTGGDVSGSLSVNVAESGWLNATTYEAVYDVTDINVEIDGLGFTLADLNDANGNPQMMISESDVFAIDTRNPQLIILAANDYEIGIDDTGAAMFELIMIFDETMNTSSNPILLFPSENPLAIISANTTESGWINSTTYSAVYNVANNEVTLMDIDISVAAGLDLAGNLLNTAAYVDFFDIDITSVGVAEFGSTNGLLFPNPALSGQSFNIQLGENTTPNRLEIYSVSGQLVHTERPLVQAGNIIVSADLAEGIYLVNLMTDQGMMNMKLQVIR
jgi:hypothetical protein